MKSNRFTLMLRSSSANTMVTWVGRRCSRLNRRSMCSIAAFRVVHSGSNLYPVALASHPQFNMSWYTNWGPLASSRIFKSFVSTKSETVCWTSRCLAKAYTFVNEPDSCPCETYAPSESDSGYSASKLNWVASSSLSQLAIRKGAACATLVSYSRCFQNNDDPVETLWH
jgi:hypothetical protein